MYGKELLLAETEIEQPQSGLTDKDLQSLCESERENAVAPDEIQNAQQLALKQYFLEPDGNEVEGQSQVQSSDVRDAVESALPILMDMFMSSESPVQFRPTHENDLDQADMETAFCQHVLHSQNAGLLLVYLWWKDALLFKNGYVKCFWDASVEEEREDYQGVSADEYAQLLQDDSYEIIAVAENPPMDPDGMLLFDVQGKRKGDAGQVRIVNVPADRVGVSGGWMSVDLALSPYAYHWEPRRKSDLIIDGFDPEIVEGLPTIDSQTADAQYLNLSQSSVDYTGRGSSGDKSRDVVAVYEHYIRADRDGDGIAELLQVTIAGEAGGTVLDVQEIDRIPLIACTPYPLPHSHFGLSLAEIVGETQRVKTAILRQTLDNLYRTNAPGEEADVSRISNPEVLANSRIGRVILKRGSEPAVTPNVVPFMAEASLGVLAKVDEMAERKTGLSPESTGLDATALAESTNMVGAMTLGQAQLRMKMVISMLAETGLKPLMLRVRELVMKNMTREEMVQLGGRWVPINPRNWREKRNTVLKVGSGTVQRQERLGVLQQIMALQEKLAAAQGGPTGMFLSPANIYNTLSEVERLLGHQSVDRYFSNPDNFTPPPPAPDPISEALEIQTAELTVKAQKDASDSELKARELSLKERQVELDERRLALEERREANRHEEAKSGNILQFAKAASGQKQPGGIKAKYGVQ